MYEGVDYKFNWVSFAIKAGIFLLLIIIAFFVVKSTIGKNKNTGSFEENLQTFKLAAIDYYSEKVLSLEENESLKKITLKEMIEKELIKTLYDEDGKKCDQDNSYAEAKKVDDSYEILVKLVCNTKTDISKTKIEVGSDKQDEDENKTEDKPNETEKSEENNNSSNTSNSSNSNNQGSSNNTNSTTTSKKKYYEFVKVNKVYTDWQQNKLTGDTVETKKDKVLMSKYCLEKTKDYYSTSYTSEKNSYQYTVTINDLPYNATNVYIKNTKYFDYDLNMYVAKINGSSLGGGNPQYHVPLPDKYTFMNSSLKSNNFNFSTNLQGSYGNYSVVINVNVWNTNNVSSYYASNLKIKIYFVPLYFQLGYIDQNSCVVDYNSNANKYSSYKIMDSYYKDVTLYRKYTYEKDYSDIKWSTSSSLDGYVKTGKTEYR